MPDFKVIYDPASWAQALAVLPTAHVLQSWAWGDFKSRWGWTAERLLWLEAGRPVAAAQVLARSIPPTPWRFLYVSKGPALDYANLPLVTQVLADLESYTKSAGGLFIKIDPDVPRQYGEPQENCPPDVIGQAILHLLEQRGWRFSPEQIQFRNTVILKLAGQPDELLANMKSKWRYNIRLAEKKGVDVRPGNEADLPLFYQMYAETAGRDGFLIRPAAYYLDVWRQFLNLNQAELWLAWVEGEPVAGLIVFIFGSNAWYMYGASTGQQRQLMPNHLLQWTAICRARARGCAHYDMWGAPDRFDQTDPMWGVYHFKRGFGGQVVQGLGAYDYPVRPMLYWLFTKMLPQFRSLWRRFQSGGGKEQKI